MRLYYFLSQQSVCFLSGAAVHVYDQDEGPCASVLQRLKCGSHSKPLFTAIVALYSLQVESDRQASILLMRAFGSICRIHQEDYQAALIPEKIFYGIVPMHVHRSLEELSGMRYLPSQRDSQLTEYDQERVCLVPYQLHSMSASGI